MTEQRLDKYLLALVSDQGVRTAYLADRMKAIQGAGLSEDERGVLENGYLDQILDFLQDCGPRPTIPEKQPIGSGSGSG